MTDRPWSLAEVAGAKALMESAGFKQPWDIEGGLAEGLLINVRTVLDAAGAAQRAELDKRCPHCGALSCDGSPPQSCSAQVRGAGAGEQE